MSRRRGYRELQADAERGTVTCPRCHECFTPLDRGRPVRQPSRLPDGFPVRSPLEQAERTAQLEPGTTRLLTAVRERVGESTFHLWIAPLRLIDADGDTLYAVVPDDNARWVRDRFGLLLADVASDLAGRPVRVEIASSSGCAPASFGGAS